MSRHLEILRRARLDEEMFSPHPARRVDRATPPRRPNGRSQWQQLAYELFLRAVPRPSTVIGLVAATPGEGASYVAQHVAAELVRLTEQATLLIEMNLHRPAQAQRHGVDPDPGLRRLLSEREFPVENCVRPSAIPHLSVLPAGSEAQAGSSEWTCIAPVMGWLRSRFFYIVADLPPVNLSTDASLLAPELDGIALVVQADLCSREVIQSAVARLHRATPNLLGAVLNRRKFVIPEAIYRRL